MRKSTNWLGGKHTLTISDEDWQNMLDEGGEWTLDPGVDFDGTLDQAMRDMRRHMMRRMGRWTIKRDGESGTVVVQIVAPVR